MRRLLELGLRMDEKVWRAKGLGNNREMIISMSLTFVPYGSSG